METINELYERTYSVEERTVFDRVYGDLFKKARIGELSETELESARLPRFMERELNQTNELERREREIKNKYAGKKVRIVLDRVPESFRSRLLEEGVQEDKHYEVVNATKIEGWCPLPYTTETIDAKLAEFGSPGDTLRLKIEDRERSAYAYFFEIVE